MAVLNKFSSIQFISVSAMWASLKMTLRHRPPLARQVERFDNEQRRFR